MDPITGMAELWGSLDLAGILKSSACDFMSLKQFLLDNMGPPRVQPTTPWLGAGPASVPGDLSATPP